MGFPEMPPSHLEEKKKKERNIAVVVVREVLKNKIHSVDSISSPKGVGTDHRSTWAPLFSLRGNLVGRVRPWL